MTAKRLVPQAQWLRGEAERPASTCRILNRVAKVETKEESKNAEAGRFDDLWALSDAEIAVGIETLSLDALNEEVARRRGR